jgi:hypothetical protein
MSNISPLRQELLNYFITNPDKIHTLSKLAAHFNNDPLKIQQMLYRFTQNEELKKRIIVVIRGNAWVYHPDTETPLIPPDDGADAPGITYDFLKNLDSDQADRFNARKANRRHRTTAEIKSDVATLTLLSAKGELTAQPPLASVPATEDKSILESIARTPRGDFSDSFENNCFWQVGKTQDGAPVLQGPDRALWRAVRL